MALTIIVMGAFLGIQNYAKRGIQGRWKQSVDQMGDQYDPRVMVTNIRHTLISNVDTAIVTTPATNAITNTLIGYWTTRRDVTNSVETKTGYSEVGAY